MKKKVLIIVVIILIILGLVGFFVGKKLYYKNVLQNIYKMSKDIHSSNNLYYSYSTDEEGNNYKKWIKDDKVLIIENDEIVQYFDSSNGTKISGNLNSKTYTNNPEGISEQLSKSFINLPSTMMGVTSIDYQNYYENIIESITKITTEKINDKECYKITLENGEIDYYLKDNFLPVEATYSNYQGSEKNVTFKYDIKQNEVIDENVKFDFENYNPVN